MRFLRYLDKGIEVVAVLAFATSSLLILLNVANRYLVAGLMRTISKSFESFTPVYHFFREHLGSLSVMADEVPGLLLVWIAFLGAYLVLRGEGHISFDMIIESVPTRFRRVLIAFNSILILGFLLLLFFQSVRMIRVSGRTEIETAEIAQGWFMLILPIAAVLLLIAFARQSYNLLMQKHAVD